MREMASKNLLIGSDALTDQGPAELGFCQTDVGGGSVLLVQALLSLALCSFHTGHVDLVGPLEGGGNQSDFTLGNAQHTADAGSIPALAVMDNNGTAHAQGGNVVHMAGQDSHITAGGADDQFLCVTVKDQSVRGV